MELGPKIIFKIGALNITETVIWGWIISIVILIFVFVSTRKMEKVPRGAQAVAELFVETVYNMVRDTMGKENLKFAPYIGTLLAFLGLGSMLGLLDCRPVTADLNTTVPLALISFVMIHYNAIRAKTAKGYIKDLASPYVFMLPMTVLDDLFFPITLAMRLFGNILAGVIVMTLLYGGLESLSSMLGSQVPFFQLVIPLPLNFFFDMFEPILQSYIFVMLTMVFTSNGMKRETED
ncbi:MAG: F0F1 ATP synthase subunit A [Eubacteriaceae bacterium]|nr:F0F1 ATP synthase subunit A [Eubacteriaceae bacterium]